MREEVMEKGKRGTVLLFQGLGEEEENAALPST